jgi:hypothetical protein
LHFDDPAYERGKIITIVAVVVALALLLAALALQPKASRGFAT